MSGKISIVQVTDIYKGSGSSIPGGMTEFRGELYFSASDPEYGNEVYKLSRNGEITRVADIYPGGSDSFPGISGFVEKRGELYFTASSSEGRDGRGLYKVTRDGTVTEAGDINPTDNNTGSLIAHRGEVYLAAGLPHGMSSGSGPWPDRVSSPEQARRGVAGPLVHPGRSSTWVRPI